MTAALFATPGGDGPALSGAALDQSGHGAARRDRPQALDAAVSHADIPVVAVDGRVTMARYQSQFLAKLRHGCFAADGKLAVLVGGADVTNIRLAPDCRHG